MRTAEMTSTNERGANRTSSGSLCLDLVATIDDPMGRQLDRLDDPTALSAWFVGVGLPEPVGGLTLDDLTEAYRLRAAVDVIARALIAGSLPDPVAVRSLNTFARHATPVFLMRSSGREHVVVAEVDAAAALAVIARDAVNLLAGPDLVRLRACEGCGALFYDRSPSGGRRWCSMQRCGERAASASYRRRQAALASA